MTASGISDQYARRLPAMALLAAALLGLCACGAAQAQDGQSEQAEAPGFHFHNDVVFTSGVGAGSSHR